MTVYSYQRPIYNLRVVMRFGIFPYQVFENSHYDCTSIMEVFFIDITTVKKKNIQFVTFYLTRVDVCV